MAIKTRIYRDSCTRYNGEYGAVLEFTLPKLQDLQESIVIEPYAYRNKMVEQASGGWMYGAFLQYYDGTRWVDIFRDKQTYITHLQSEQRMQADLYSDGQFEYIRGVFVNLLGKKIRFGSTYESELYDINEGSIFYLDSSTTYKTPVCTGRRIVREHENSRYSIILEMQNCTYWSGIVTSGNKQTQIDSTTPHIYYSSLVDGQVSVDISLQNGDVNTSYNTTFYHYTPTISSLKIENDNGLIDDITNISWSSTNQGKAEIYNNGSLIKSINGSISIAVLPKGTLNVGKNKIQVRVYNIVDESVVNSNIYVYAESTITLKRIEPTITKDSFTISDTNIDNKITFNWIATNQSRFAIYQGDKLITNGSTNQTCTLNEGMLNTGTSNIKLVIYYDSGFDVVQATFIIEATLKRNDPFIYNLEPSNLNINVDEIISVTFATNEFCERWELTAAGLNTKGTDARSVSFGKEVFKQGKNEMTLKIFYSPKYNNEIRTATKKVTFTGYGTPKTPVFDGNVLYSTATPQLTWESIDQVEIHLLIVEAESEEVVQEKLEFTEDKFAMLETLEDDKTYIATLAVKNKYGLWSEYAKKEFQTKFNDIILPTFDLFEAETSVFITIGGIQDPNFKAISIYRKSEREDVWTEIADDCNIEDTIRDYMCPANLKIAYKLRVYDKNNAYKDTEIKTISISLSSYILTNLENAEDVYMIFGTPSYKFNGDFVSKLYAGQRAPRTFKGKVQYKTGTFRTALKNADAYNLIDFIENSNEYNLFCLRDQRGEKLYVIARLESQDPKGLKRLSVSFNFTEVNFIESKMYTGSGYKKISYLNGEYYLDGSVDLSGYDLSVTLE